LAKIFAKNKILSRYLSWPSKKKSRQKTKKARELFFSRPKKKKTIKPLSNITKKYWPKKILGTFFEQNSNLTLFETGKHST
jgi:hypothetical protein